MRPVDIEWYKRCAENNSFHSSLGFVDFFNAWLNIMEWGTHILMYSFFFFKEFALFKRISDFCNSEMTMICVFVHYIYIRRPKWQLMIYPAKNEAMERRKERTQERWIEKVREREYTVCVYVYLNVREGVRGTSRTRNKQKRKGRELP